MQAACRNNRPLQYVSASAKIVIEDGMAWTLLHWNEVWLHLEGTCALRKVGRHCNTEVIAEAELLLLQ